MAFDVLNPTLDFNCDGRADIYWRNDLANANAIWLMDGTNIIGSSFLPDTAEEYGWSEPTFGDFDGNGRTDFFWHNQYTGANVLWLMNGTEIQATSLLPATSNDWEYQIVDFNGDGTTDLFWHNQSNGATANWMLEDGLIAEAAFIATVPPEWQAYVADFNGDRKTDLFWRNEDYGFNAIWKMDGSEITSSTWAETRSLEWIPTIADFNGDGLSDIFWHNWSGANQLELYTSWVTPFPTQTIDLPTTPIDIGVATADVQFDVIYLDGQASIMAIDPLYDTVNIWAVAGSTLITAGGDTGTNLFGYDFDFVDFDADGTSDVFLYDQFTGDIAISTLGNDFGNPDVFINLPPEWGWEANVAIG